MEEWVHREWGPGAGGHQAAQAHLAVWARQVGQVHRVAWDLVEVWDHPVAREGAGSKPAEDGIGEARLSDLFSLIVESQASTI